MALYIQNLNNGDADEKGHLRLLGTFLTQSGVRQAGAFLVAAQASPDMTVKVAGAAVGHDIAFINSDGALYHGWNTSDYPVTIGANATGVTKKDAIVAYADLVSGAGLVNNPGSLKIIAVRGSGTNTAPDNAQIIASPVGSNPYVVLAHVTVANGAAAINSGNISDQRTRSFLAGEQLGSLSVSGGAIAAGSITPVKTDKIWWEELGRTTLASAGDVISVTVAARKYLQIRGHILNSGSITMDMRFNSDGGNNYANRIASNGVADATNASQAYLNIIGAASVQHSFVADVVNPTSQEKLVIVHNVNHGAAGAATTPNRQEVVAKWSNTSNQITNISLLNLSTGDFAIGSELVVLGHD